MWVYSKRVSSCLFVNFKGEIDSILFFISHSRHTCGSESFGFF